MKKVIVKYSKLSPEMRKIIRDKLENEDVNFFSFPYQGNMEEGFLLEQEDVNYLVIVDNEKKSTYKPDDDDDDDDDIDDDDFGAVSTKDIDVDDVDDEDVADEEDDDYDEPEEFDEDDED